MKEQIESLISVTERNLRSYGEEVVMQRAVPDYRDGLKPVHRAILWASYGLGLKPSSPFKKSARTVGEVLGKYHPHSDSSAYQAMVGLAGTKDEDTSKWLTRNTSIPLIEGYGNWGDNIDPAGAHRYTEARLSKFAYNYLLDSIYLAVSDFVPNFSGDDRIPVVLPAKLPVLLLNGSESVAFGISASCPSFAPAGVLSLIKEALKGTTVDYKLCAQHLKFEFYYGGVCVSDRKTILAFFKAGKATLEFRPTYKVVPEKRMIILDSACPGLVKANSWATLTERLLKYKEIKSAVDCSDKHGFRFEITANRDVEEKAFVSIVEKETTRKEPYDIGITIRELDSVSFKHTTISEIVNSWCVWRIALEVKAIKYLLAKETEALRKVELYLLAVLNLEIILKALKVEDSALFLSKKLKITLEEANEILDMKVRQLKTLEAKNLKAKISEIKKEVANLNSELKTPAKRILKSLDGINASTPNTLEAL